MSVTVDARGLRCPWPVLRLARAMRSTDSATIIADDPAAPGEIAARGDLQKIWISKKASNVSRDIIRRLDINQ